MQEIQLIAVDMDGTLLNSQQEISEANAAALRAAVEAGIHVAICSGRMVEDISTFARNANIACWPCGCNGARLLDAPFGALLERHNLTPEAANACIDILQALDLPFNGYYDATTVIVQPSGGSAVQTQWMQESQRRGHAVRVGVAALREAAAGEGVIKLVAFEDAATGRLEEAKARLAAVADIEITSSGKDNIEIMPIGIGKGKALAGIAARLGVPREAVMAVGDQENDRSMLSWAGVPVAMGNATPGIQALAVHVTGHCDDSGVGQAVRRLALGQEA